MRIVVNHLTRMQAGFFCVAGVDLATGRHVRPVLQSGQLGVELLARHGGPFDMANVVELGEAIPTPEPPHVEDHLFDPACAKFVQEADAGKFWRMLESGCGATLREAFGKAFGPLGAGLYGTHVGEGHASLACLRPKRRPRLRLDTELGKPRVRMQLCDGRLEIDLPVTDIRLYADDHTTPDAGLVRRAAERLAEAEDAILSVGLGRAFARALEEVYYHHLQVNNLHFKEDPAWRLG